MSDNNDFNDDASDDVSTKSFDEKTISDANEAKEKKDEIADLAFDHLNSKEHFSREEEADSN